MNICIDVGNSTIGIGAFKDNKLVERMVVTTDPRFTEDEFYQLFKKPFAVIEKGQDTIDSIIYSSVVPQINVPLLGALKKLTNIDPLLINANTKTDLSTKVDNPLEIGNDLIADLVGAKEKYGFPCLIADLGTASKILLLDNEGAFTSCLIMPGLTLSAESLSNKAALLPEVSLIAPDSVMAKNTLGAMNAGIVYGHADMILGLIKRYESELGYTCMHILTGGGAVYLKEILKNDFIYDQNLNLDGLNIIINKNSKQEIVMAKDNFYQNLVKPYQKEMMKSLKELIAIDSTYDESTKDKENPFGKGVSKALQYIADMAKKDGFIVNNYDNYVVEILTNELEPNVTIMAHTDIVPVGTGWPQSPFEMVEKDGTLYARGVADDKGPLMSCYYGLKALRDNNLLGNYQVRFLVGGNEERGSLCMEHYFQTLKKKQPTYGFSPDSAYPLTYAEKGIIGFVVRGKINLPQVISIEGGVASNSVIEKCEVVLKEDDFDLITYLNEKEVDYSYIIKGHQLTLTFNGVAAHGSVPWMGKNAALSAVKNLGEYYKNKDLLKLYDLYSAPRGEGVNAAAHSEDMGDNSLNVGLFSLENGQFEMTVNYRHVETVTAEQMISNIKEASKPFEVEVLSISKLLYYPKDSELITTLLKVYQEETGDYKTPIIASGGGTYAKEANNIVAFGMEYPGYDCKMHGVNECTEKKYLFESMGIYAHAIVELGKKI